MGVEVHAFSFLEHMGTQFLSKGDNYLLTKKGNGDLYLLCYNFCWFRQNGLIFNRNVTVIFIVII